MVLDQERRRDEDASSSRQRLDDVDEGFMRAIDVLQDLIDDDQVRVLRTKLPTILA